MPVWKKSPLTVHRRILKLLTIPSSVFYRSIIIHFAHLTMVWAPSKDWLIKTVLNAIIARKNTKRKNPFLTSFALNADTRHAADVFVVPSNIMIFAPIPKLGFGEDPQHYPSAVSALFVVRWFMGRFIVKIVTLLGVWSVWRKEKKIKIAHINSNLSLKMIRKFHVSVVRKEEMNYLNAKNVEFSCVNNAPISSNKSRSKREKILYRKAYSSISLTENA